jgi:hypothetical protein
MSLNKLDSKYVESLNFYCNSCAKFAPKTGKHLIGKVQKPQPKASQPPPPLKPSKD